MPQPASISVLVKLSVWEHLQTAVSLMLLTARRRLQILLTLIVLFIAVPFAVAIPKPFSIENLWRAARYDNSDLWRLFRFEVLLLLCLTASIAILLFYSERTRGGIRYRFSNTGVHAESFKSAKEYPWAAILKARETSSAFLIYFAPTFAQILPFRCFSSPVDVVILRELLRANVEGVQLTK